jgi:hypothetical protein
MIRPMDRPTLDYEPTPDEVDAGRFAGRYLQIISLSCVGWSVADCILNRSRDFGFVLILLFFWAGSALKRRSRIAWTIVLWYCRLSLLFCVAFAIVIPVCGAIEFQFRVAGVGVARPVASQLLLVAAQAVVVAVPYGVLQTPNARRQFRL